MKSYYLLYFIISLLLQLKNLEIKAQTPDFAWAKRAGGAQGDAASRVTVDASGNTYLTGIFRGVANFGTIELTSSGVADIFIAKYDATGNVLWAKQAGGQNIDAAKNIEVDGSGNCYITGEFQGNATFGTTTLTSTGSYDMFIAKYDASGNAVWAKQAGGLGLQMGRGIAVDLNGNCYVTGYFDGIANFETTSFTSSGIYDVFIAKYDASGNFQWANRAGSNGEDFGRNLAVDESGNTYVTGTFKNNASFGNLTLTSSGVEDIFIAKYDALGNVVWAKKAGGINKDAASGIDIDSKGNTYITGEFQGNSNFEASLLTSASALTDIFIAKYDASGNVVWAKRAGGNSNDFGRNISIDESGNIYITGEFEGNTSFDGLNLFNIAGSDIFIAKYDAFGNALWAKMAGGNLEDRAAGIAADGSGNIYISGYFLGEASFGNTTLTSNGESDIYIAKLSSVTGLSDISTNLISAHPNPFTNFLTISLPTPDSATAILTDMLGKQVHSQVLNPDTGGATATLTPDPNLPSGTYMLRVHQGDTVKQAMVVRK